MSQWPIDLSYVKQLWYFRFFFELNCRCYIVFIVFSCLPISKIACLPVPSIPFFFHLWLIYLFIDRLLLSLIPSDVDEQEEAGGLGGGGVAVGGADDEGYDADAGEEFDAGEVVAGEADAVKVAAGEVAAGEVAAGEEVESSEGEEDVGRRRPARGRRAGRGAGRGGAGRDGGGRGGAARGGGRRRGAGRRGAGVPQQQAEQSYDTPDNDANVIPPFTPHRPPGVHFPRIVLRNAMTTAVEFFKLFFTVELVSSIAEHTNSYGYIHILDGHHDSYAQSDGSWKDTTTEEIFKLIGLHIYFGLVKVSSLRKYWSTRSPYHGLWARAVMSRNIYFALMSMLHVVDPLLEVAGNKLRKVHSLIDHFRRKCKELYQPSQNVAIDERMVKSRHRSGMRQYIKNKPTKWGIKLWVLADSSKGYTYDFDVYIGRDAAAQRSIHGLGYDVVQNLMNPLRHQGYHLYTDNFYTSTQLLQDLYDVGVVATGTVSKNRRGFPANLKNSKQWARGKDRGSMRWERNPPVLALQWKDNKVVSLLSTIDNANDVVYVSRKAKTNNVWRTLDDVPQPALINH